MNIDDREKAAELIRAAEPAWLDEMPIAAPRPPESPQVQVNSVYHAEHRAGMIVSYFGLCYAEAERGFSVTFVEDAEREEFDSVLAAMGFDLDKTFSC